MLYPTIKFVVSQVGKGVCNALLIGSDYIPNVGWSFF